jgi:outer membrane lipoprotein-sorting protein
MNKLLRQGIVIFAFAVIIGSSSAEASGQDIMGQILRRMDMYNKSLQSLQANVTMVKHNPQLNVSDTSIGSTSYLPKNGKRAMYVRIDWIKPTEEMISVIGDKYELYRPRLKQVIRGTVDKAKNNASAGGALGFMNMSREQLKANYETTLVGEENVKDGTPTWRLLLVPKVRTSYKTAELWVDKDGTPRQVKITEHNNDWTTVFLENIRKNATIEANRFKLNIPRDAKEVK